MASATQYSNPVTSLAPMMTDKPEGEPVSVILVVLFCLGGLCAVLAAIYSYIYYTRINPRSSRARQYVEQATNDDDGAQGAGTHLFLFRKS